jgi:ribosomal protein S18 acetylase RimI-like enzyme
MRDDITDELPVGLTLRPPTGADHARVLAVLDAWWGGLGGPAGEAQRRMLLPRLFFDHFGGSSFLVERAGDRAGEVVAFLIGFLSPTHIEQAYIHFVGVDPALRGRGLGALLYRRFFRYAAAHGRREVRCITGPVNQASVAFHARMGFAVEPGPVGEHGVPVQLDYDGPGLDRVAFVRSLDP